ncbi:Ankyrin repeat domain-containing protein 32 [Aphelenchoides fujianensis]|nr:Ankyrin repeat domain-containing protein 32 [Aphelenchoides fujianensis]
MMPSTSTAAAAAAAAAAALSRPSIRFVFVNVPEVAFNRFERAAIVAQYRAFNILQTAGFRPAFRADAQLLSKQRSPAECIYVLPAFCGVVFDHLLTLKSRQVIISPLVVIQVNELGGVFPMSLQPLWSLSIDGKVLTTIGFGPDEKADIERQVVRHGGLFRPTITAEVNWIVAVDSVTSLSQLRVAQNQNIQLVNREWLNWIEHEAYEFLHERDQFFEPEEVQKYEIRPCSPPYLSQHHVHVETQTRTGNAIIWDDKPIGSSGASQYPCSSVRMEGYTQMEGPNVRYVSDDDEDYLDDEERALVERWKRQTIAEQETERRAPTTATSHFDPFAMGATGQRTGVVSEATNERTRSRRSKPPPPPPVEQREEGELEDSEAPNPLDAALNSAAGFRGFSASSLTQPNAAGWSSRFPNGQSNATGASALTNQSEAEADDGGQTKSIVVTNSTQRTQRAGAPVFAVPPEPRSAPSTRSRSTTSVHTARTAEPPPPLAAALSPVGAPVATAVPPSVVPSAPVRVAPSAAAPTPAPAAVLSPVGPPPAARPAAPSLVRPVAPPTARPVPPSLIRQPAQPTAPPAAPPPGRKLIFRSPVGPPAPQEEPTGWHMPTPNPVPPAAAEPPADELPHNRSHDSLSDFVVPDEQWAIWAQEVEESRRRRGLNATRNTNNVTSANTTAATATNGLVRPPPPPIGQRQVPPPNVGLVQQSPGGSQRRRLGIGKRMLPVGAQQANGGDEEADRKRRKSGVAGAFRSPSPLVGHAPEPRRQAAPPAQRPNPGEPVFMMGQLQLAVSSSPSCFIPFVRSLQMKNTLRRKLNNAPIRSSVVDEYEPSVTHVITRKLVRSEKLLCAIATGKFVLVNEYVHDSVATRSWMKEDAYEFGNPRFGYAENCALEADELKVAAACFKWRKKKTEHPEFVGAFQHWNILLYMKKPQKKEVFRRLIEAGGGRVTFREDVRDTPRFADYTAAFAQDTDQRVTAFEVKSMITAAVRCYRVEYIGQYLLEDASKLRNEEVYNPVFLSNIHDANLGASLQTSP